MTDGWDTKGTDWEGLGCLACKHFDRAGACPAFPRPEGGIPIEIASGQFDHRHPFPGDRGVRFEPRPGKGGAEPVRDEG